MIVRDVERAFVGSASASTKPVLPGLCTRERCDNGYSLARRLIKVKAAGNEHLVIKKGGSGNFFAADTFALRRGVEIRAKSLTASVKFPHDRHKNMDLWRCQSSGNTETGARADRQTGMQ
jgi:hypothetical protein